MEPKRNIVQRVGMLDGKQIAMDIDPAMTAHIMSVLTDLYSDSEMAVIRELSTNARDSHLESGQTRPIEIVLPNAMNPYLVIRDFGLGLSVDEVEQIYSKYGASTKRDSNDYNGMLGLGSKSPLTYTNQFMITARKNGVQIILSVSRLEDGRGGMTVIDTSSTLEPNGVEIQIPVKRDHDFHHKVAKFFKWWPQGSVLVNGKQPERFVGEEIVPGIWTVPGESDKIVMGGVAYPAIKSLFEENPYRYRRAFGVVAFVEIGDVDFTPNREALKDKDPDTVAKHKEIKSKFNNAIRKQIQDTINAQPDRQAVLVKIAEYVRQYSGTSIDLKSFTYKGEHVPGSFDRVVTITDQHGRVQKRNVGFRYFYPNRNRNNVNLLTQISNDPGRFDKHVIVYNMPNDDKPTQTQRQKLRRWMEDNSKNVSAFICVKDDFGGKWTAHVEKIDYQTVIKPISLNDKTRSSAKYMTINTRGYGVEAQTVDESKDVYYWSPTEGYDSFAIRQNMPDAELVVIAANRFDKFKRDYPKAQHIYAAAKEMLKNAEANLTPEDKIRLGVDYTEREILAAIPPGQITDPEVDKYVKALHDNNKSVTQSNYTKAVAMVRAFRVSAGDISVPKVLTKYPLACYSRYSARSNMKHIIAYINMVNKENI